MREKPTLLQREHINRKDSNPGPSCCEVTAPQFHLASNTDLMNWVQAVLLLILEILALDTQNFNDAALDFQTDHKGNSWFIRLG